MLNTVDSTILGKPIMLSTADSTLPIMLSSVDSTKVGIQLCYLL